MGLWNSVVGAVCVEITCPSVTDMITKIGNAGISIENVDIENEMVFTCSIKRSDYWIVSNLSHKLGCQIKIKQRLGLYWLIRGLSSRPVILIGSALLLLLAFYIPTRVLFVNVEGNQNLSEYQILEAADQCGISFGASRRNVRSEKMKNALLDALPELQWAGVNTYGCVAVITVRERANTDENQVTNRVSSIVATQDGIVNQMTVKEGNPLCRVGQAVKKGETLVSGYTDCGRTIRAERSVGEIFAYTTRNLTAVSPATMSRKTVTYEEKSNLSLIIGKKLINLSQDSGISDITCDKIYKKITLTLPGGFELPVSILYTQCILRETQPGNTMQVELEKMAADYLQDHMVAGEILNSYTKMSRQQGVVVLNGTYFCNEMIGQERSEEHCEGYE